MLATAKYLSEYLREKKPLLEKNPPRQQKAVPPPAKAAMYHNGIQKGIGHGVNTATKFAPHVAGSAIGAFVGGLKGQSLASEHGQIKITDLEKELEMVDFRNPASIKAYTDKQTRQHFSQYTPEQQKVISQYQQKLIADTRKGVKFTPELIKKQIASLPGNPFKNLADPDALVANLMARYEAVKAISTAKPAAATKVPARTAGATMQQTTPAMKEAISALGNQGYTKKNAELAVNQAIGSNPKLKDDMDALFRAAHALVRK